MKRSSFLKALGLIAISPRLLAKEKKKEEKKSPYVSKKTDMHSLPPGYHRLSASCSVYVPDFKGSCTG